MSNSILVTGASGFVGRHVVDLLTTAGRHVIGVDADSAKIKTACYRHHRVDLVSCPTVDLVQLLSDVDCVLHLAAASHVPTSFTEPGTYFRNNVGGTQRLLAALRREPRPLVHVSTCEIYGNVDYAVTEAAPMRPLSPYAVSKAVGERMARAAGRSDGFGPIVVLRPFNQMGPGQQADRLIPSVVQAALAGRPTAVSHLGRQVRDYSDVRDLASAASAALDLAREGTSGTYNICSGVPRTVRSVVDDIYSLLGVANQREIVLEPVSRPLMSSFGAPTRARQALGWTSASSYEASLRETIDSITSGIDASC